MTTSFLRPAMAVLACTAALAFASPSLAAMVKMKADLKTASEVPPVNGSGAGSVDISYDSDSKKLTWKGSYSGLTGAATAAHFHGPAEPGKNAGVAVPIFAAATAESPFEGEATLNDTQASDLMAGRWYVNIHTDANKAGEIRGQVTK